MNIFILDLDMQTNAKYYVNSHISKMPLETAQLLYSVFYFTGQPELAKYELISNPKHPCALWVRESLSNWLWLRELGIHLCAEFEYRYLHKHACESHIKNMPIPNLIDKGLTPFAQSMPIQYKNDNIVKAYRDYYNYDKRHLFYWKGREVPFWILENLSKGDVLLNKNYRAQEGISLSLAYFLRNNTDKSYEYLIEILNSDKDLYGFLNEELKIKFLEIGDMEIIYKAEVTFTKDLISELNHSDNKVELILRNFKDINDFNLFLGMSHYTYITKETKEFLEAFKIYIGNSNEDVFLEFELLRKNNRSFYPKFNLITMSSNSKISENNLYRRNIITSKRQQFQALPAVIIFNDELYLIKSNRTSKDIGLSHIPSKYSYIHLATRLYDEQVYKITEEDFCLLNIDFSKIKGI